METIGWLPPGHRRPSAARSRCRHGDTPDGGDSLLDRLPRSETTVRRRVDQLREAGLLYFDLELDMPAFGFRSSAWLWLSVTPSHLARAGAALAEFPQVAYAAATTGPANLAACAVCRDEESLYEFLTAQVGALPGVERVETAPVIRTVKQASPVMVPRQLPRLTSKGGPGRPARRPAR